MSYNESLSPNSNYPTMSQSQWDSAPFNQSEIPEKDFNVTISQTLSKSVTLTTDDYTPGASGVDYEDDGEGGSCAYSWHDPDDTSDTNWENEYDENGYYTPLQLIQLLKEYLQKDLVNIDDVAIATDQNKTFLEGKIKHLIEECDCWTNDETEFIEES